MTGQPARRRDAAATRLALLDAAEKLFAERGFDRTTVREIAKLAEANQALLFRYFGSKDALFEEVVARRGRARLAGTPRERLVEDTLRAVLDPNSGGQEHALETMLRSAGSDSAAAAIRREVGEEYTRALAGLTDSADAELRADLVLAWVLGIGLMRVIAQKEPVASADVDEVVALVREPIRMLLERA